MDLFFAITRLGRRMKLCILWIVILSGSFLSGAEPRLWTLDSGYKFKAELVQVMGDKAVLKDALGERVKVDLALLSSEDQLFIELENPPKLEISFRRKSKKKHFPARVTTKLLPEVQINTFGVRVKQKSAGPYNHEMRVEFFALGKERAGDRFILLDRQERSFSLTTANHRTHEFWGGAVSLDKYEIFYITRPRGKKYAGHLIVITDVRGRMIATQTSFDWLLENLSDLKKVPVGGYMDKTCTRTFPTRPKPCRY